MKNSTLHRQCSLTRDGNVSTTVWLPVNLAKVGKNVEFKDSKGVWEGFTWKIASVSQVEREC